MSEAQVNLLIERLRPVVHRRAGLAVAVVGEAGVGKTHSVRALLARLACRSASASVHAGPAAWAAALPPLQRTTLWAERSLERLVAGQPLPPSDLAAALASRLKGAAPFVLHLEDAHEADPAALEALGLLADAVRLARGAALLVTSRETLPPPFIVSKVEPLDPDATLQLLQQEAGAELPAEAVAWIQGRVAGHPLYALEYFRYLSRLGHLWNDGRTWRWRAPSSRLLPASVEALVEQRLQQARREADDLAVVGARAMLGDDPNPLLWAKVAGLSKAKLLAAARRLAQAGVLADPDDGQVGTGGFAHPLFREVSLRTLDAGHRRDMARRAVAALQSDPLQAARFVEAADLPSEQTLRTLVAAADACSADDPLAAARLRAAASHLAKGEERPRLAAKAALVLQHHDLSEAKGLLEVAVAHPATRPETIGPLTSLLALSGRQAEADDLADRLLPEIYPDLPPAALKLASRHVAGDHQGAWTVWQAHPQLWRTSSPEVWRSATGAAVATGRMAEAKELIEQGLNLTDDQHMRVELLSLRALIQFHGGDPQGADDTMLEVLALLEEIDAPRLRATALLNRGAFLRMTDNYQARGECLEESLRIRQGSGDGKAYAFAMVGLADLRLEQGRFEEAEDLLTEAIGTLELYGPSRFLTVARSIACKLGVAQGTRLSLLTALRQIELALAEARQAGNPRVLREIINDAALAYAADGQAERALALARESAGLAEAAGDSPTDAYHQLWATGLAKRSLGQEEEAAAALEQALRLAQASEGAIETHKIGLHLARLRGDAADAADRLAWFEERGLGHGASLARSLFPELAGEEKTPTAPATEDAPWTLEVLGPMQMRGERTLPLRGEKRQMLLAALLEARAGGRHGLSRLDLLELLYPDQDEIKAGVSLRQLVLGLRRDFGPRLLLTTPDGYALGDGDSDFERFLARPGSVRWRGPYLSGLQLDGPVRDTLHMMLARHVRDLILQDPQEAARLGTILHEAEPYRLDYLAIGLEALRAAGNHRSLGRRYQQARAQAAELGEDLPEGWQDFLAEAAERRSTERPGGFPS